VPAWYLWQRRPRQALLFAVCMAPAVAIWQLWAARHSTPVGDDLVYYTQYITYWLRNVSLAELPNMVLKNFDGLLTGMGGLFWFNPPGSFLHSAAARVLAVAAIAGVFRLLDRPSVQIYSLFAIPFLVQLLLWNFTPHERFSLPLSPLLLLGLAATSRHLWELYRQSRAKQPVASALIAGTWGLLLAAALVRNGEGMFVSLPQLCEQDRQIAAAQQPVYGWLRESAPAGATVLTTDDSTLYLHTGRPALARLLPTRLFYQDDRAAILAFYSHLPALPVRFLLLGPPIHRGQMGERDRVQVQSALASLPNAKAVRQWGAYTLYAIAPQPAQAVR
jgi:hypothetical protein